MALVLGSDLTGQELAEKIAAMAAGKSHKLASYQVDGRHPVSPAAADGIMKYLDRCPDRAVPEDQMTRPTGAEHYFTERAAASPEYQEALTAARAPRLTIQDITAGFYATPSRTGNNDLDFWKVTVRDNGFKVVKRVLGGGTDKSPRLEPAGQQQQAAALSAIIRTGLEESQRLFSSNMSRCQDCGHTLTDEESRAAGRGPVCRNK